MCFRKLFTALTLTALLCSSGCWWHRCCRHPFRDRHDCCEPCGCPAAGAGCCDCGTPVPVGVHYAPVPLSATPGTPIPVLK